MSIHALDDATINQIAAGEVVENPASVVKELVENAIDAGANDIAVEYIGGGLKEIRVIDNGRGMNERDARLSIERHATSKVQSIADVHTVMTRGFRGEALASIASVSKMKLTTSEGGEAVELRASGGVVSEVEVAARNRGTTVEVRELFFNVAARRKFQKSAAASASEIMRVMVALSLSDRCARFTLRSQGKTLLEARSSDMKIRINEVLGAALLGQGCAVSYCQNGIEVLGYIGAPHKARATKSGQHLFINGRNIQSSAIGFAVKDGYGTRIEERKHPVFVLYVAVPPHTVDVNVHPQKKCVRFHDEVEVKQCIRSAVAQSFLRGEGESASSSDELFLSEDTEPLEEEGAEWPMPVQEAYNEDASEREASFPCLFSETPQLRMYGKYGHYLIVDGDSLPAHAQKGLCLIDLKAASRRVYFERLERELPAIQALLTPKIIAVEKGFILQDSDIRSLQALGLSLHRFGDDAYAIDGTDEMIDQANLESLFHDALHTIQICGNVEEKRKNALKLLAIKHMKDRWSHKTLAEAEALVEALFTTDEPLRCPQGKKTVVWWSDDDLKQCFAH